jgi:hypothetical protein
MIRDIILSQKSEFERKLNEKYIDREVSLKGIDSDLIFMWLHRWEGMDT